MDRLGIPLPARVSVRACVRACPGGGVERSGVDLLRFQDAYLRYCVQSGRAGRNPKTPVLSAGDEAHSLQSDDRAR